MAWNRPQSDSPAKVSPRRAGTVRPTIMRGVFAGLVVAACAGIVAWWLWSSGESAGETPPPRKEGLIREVTPAKQKTTSYAQEKLEHPGMVKFRGKWYPEYNKAGGRIWLCGDKVLYHTAQIHTNRLSESQISPERKYFDTHFDQELAILINAPLGATRIGPEKPYGKGTNEKFLKSLATPIIIKDDDAPEVKELKRAVIETKADLKARYDAGEDIADILNKSAKEMHELALYKTELMKMVNAESRKVENLEDRAALYESANRMLKDRGLPPMKLPYLLSRKLEMQRLNQKETTK